MEKNALDRVLQYGADTGIRREDEGRWVAGVCVGLGQRWNVDPVLFRVGFLLLALFAGVGAAAYLVCWLMLPASDGSIALERAVRRGDGGAIALLVVTAIAVLGSLTPGWDGRPVSLIGLLVLVGVVWFLVRRSRPSSVTTSPPTSSPSAPAATSVSAPAGSAAIPARGPDAETRWAASTPQDTMPVITGIDADASRTSVPPSPLQGPIPTSPTPAPARRRSWAATWIIAGLATLAYMGVEALPSATMTQRWMLPLAAALAVLGGGLVVTAAVRRHPPFVTLAAWLVGISLAVSVPATTAEFGDTVWRPTTAEQVQSRYDAGVEDVVLDLTAVPTSDGVKTLRVDHGVGDVDILVPGDVTTSVTGEVGVGQLVVEENGTTREAGGGVGVARSVEVGSGPQQYDITVDHGVGEIRIRVAEEAGR